MVILINDKEISVVRGKKGSVVLIKKENELNIKKYKTSKRNISRVKLDDAFSDFGLTINNFRIFIIGNPLCYTVKVIRHRNRKRYDTYDIYHFNILDLIEGYYLKTNLPNYIKEIINQIAKRIPKRQNELKIVPYRVIRRRPIHKDEIVVCAKDNTQNVRISKCRLCVYFIRIIKKEIGYKKFNYLVCSLDR